MVSVVRDFVVSFAVIVVISVVFVVPSGPTVVVVTENIKMFSRGMIRT